ncbi:hypothetical protein CONLIGDRAFT_715452 [Coniochaeta ligniaria NRRL 30616]|uniref:ABC multidrug transporter atrF n=1 Tax=Coniochaeta ligniaria NRRL 30616 TaxID=1408157 RepID=A0A1J7IN74_9PEZI|nr:hypothetical protein CONLIGDRAFT_715452 [Coniochaeta ligniaria NRRL 30616]
MWGQKSEEMLRRAASRQGSEAYPNTLHNRDESHASPPEESQDELPSRESPSAVQGTWGERDVGGPVSQRAAMEEFEELQRELSRATSAAAPSLRSNARSRRRSGVFRTASRKSAATAARRGSRATNARDRDADSDVEEAQDDDEEDQGTLSSPKDEGEGEFELERFMREGHLEKRNETGESAKKVGVVYKHLTVKGVGSSTAFVRTLPDAILGTFGPDLYKILSNWIPALRFRKHEERRTLIHDFTGVVRHGEMMLVLGRPGSGCSTFLKVIANDRESYAEVTGEVTYGGISAEEVAARYRGEVVYNAEDDQHLPNLTVEQTLRFSLLNKAKKHARGDVDLIVDALMKMFGISHTRNTLVGNEYVRGVSGGERKRVSIAETLATKSTVACWDNSTRGLDASTALDYAKSLRIMTDVSDRTTITTLYQAGEEIYQLMDKVLVIDQGRMLYQGPANEARQYFHDLGYHAPPRQTTADFLTSISDVNARQFREGWEDKAPKTAEDLEKAFRASETYKRVLADVDDFERHLKDTDCANTREFQESVREQKSRTVSKHSNYTVSFWKQILVCTRREFWLIWGDRTSLYTKFSIIFSNGLIVGSLFYDTPPDSAGAFLRGGVVFFSIVFLGWLQLSELMKAVSGRNIIARHKSFAFYRPSAVNLARMLADVPMLALQVVIFGVIMYFMTNLDVDAGKFFIFLLFIYVTTFCVTSLYRMLAAMSPSIDDAVRFSGLGLNLLIIFTGYVIAKPIMLGQKIWFGWIYYINPLAYSYEAVLTNEFHNRILTCDPSQLVPQGPGIQPANQGCAIAGAVPGGTGVSGDVYVATQYEYSRSHLWRNFGIVIAFMVFYIAVTVAATETLNFSQSGGGALLFKPSKRAKKQGHAKTADEEKAGDAGDDGPTSREAVARTRTQDEVLGELERSESIFTWEDLCYTVPTAQGPKRLLNNVRGYAKPGVMVALMGASGAGKTTLLQTLSQRQTVGVVTGDMLVDGRPLGIEFQRGTGFVEQMDLHDETATVREALEFSALLRQRRDTPRGEKLEYVEKIVDLLELNDIQDAIIASLGVEQKKRLTIGVELAAKPSLLLFLDEPTSGLDSQSAFSIVRFLRKLCAAGQAIVCTIHQPSADLIQQFDKILALNPGGNVFYFGPVGDDGSDVIKYFSDRGVDCPPGKNPAEFILETAAKGGRKPDGKRIDWNAEWLNSSNYQALIQEMTAYKTERSAAPTPPSTSQHQFAAPVALQISALTKRMFLHQWRSPSYVYGMLFTAVIIGVFNGFTFWQLGDSVASMQNRMFTVFVIIMIPPTVLNAVLPNFYQARALWEAREHPSRIYGWVAFCTASVLSEVPHSVAAALVYWLLWYYPAGLPAESGSAGYVFLMTTLYFLFQSSWGQWVCAFAPSFTVISNVLPFFLVIFSLFNGVVVPYAQLNVFWKYWLYYLNPATYWIAGVLASTLRGQPVVCAEGEAARFEPLGGQTCGRFAGKWVSAVGRGYLMNPDAMGGCAYCPYASGEEFLASLNITPGEKWRDFGIFLAFCVSNWALVYFFIYTVRVKGWSFGFGLVSKVLGKAVGRVKRVLMKAK